MSLRIRQRLSGPLVPAHHRTLSLMHAGYCGLCGGSRGVPLLRSLLVLLRGSLRSHLGLILLLLRLRLVLLLRGSLRSHLGLILLLLRLRLVLLLRGLLPRLLRLLVLLLGHVGRRNLPHWGPLRLHHAVWLRLVRQMTGSGA